MPAKLRKAPSILPEWLRPDGMDPADMMMPMEVPLGGVLKGGNGILEALLKKLLGKPEVPNVADKVMREHLTPPTMPHEFTAVGSEPPYTPPSFKTPAAKRRAAPKLPGGKSGK